MFPWRGSAEPPSGGWVRDVCWCTGQASGFRTASTCGSAERSAETVPRNRFREGFQTVPRNRWATGRPPAADRLCSRGTQAAGKVRMQRTDGVGWHRPSRAYGWSRTRRASFPGLWRWGLWMTSTDCRRRLLLSRESNIFANSRRSCSMFGGHSPADSSAEGCFLGCPRLVVRARSGMPRHGPS